MAADGFLADTAWILPGRVPMPPWALMTCGPPQFPVFRRGEPKGLRSGLRGAVWAHAGMGPIRKRPVTEGAVFYNGAGGRAFAAMWDLRLVGCQAAGRASRWARSAMCLTIPRIVN